MTLARETNSPSNPFVLKQKPELYVMTETDTGGWYATALNALKKRETLMLPISKGYSMVLKVDVRMTLLSKLVCVHRRKLALGNDLGMK